MTETHLDLQREETRIREVFERAARAWTRNDAAAYAAEFAEDSDYVAFDGTRVRGREGNRRLHEELFRTVLYGTRMVGEIESIRFLGPDVAVLHATGSVAFAWQRKIPRSRLSRNTWVLQRIGDEWKVVAFHNSRIRPVPSNPRLLNLVSKVVRWRTARARRGTAPRTTAD
ncbi:MAG TPA: SgcJ/EcaC family oxidoreductase [Pseudonocardiaceae bacterium]